jgi:hypothetical protein
MISTWGGRSNGTVRMITLITLAALNAGIGVLRLSQVSPDLQIYFEKYIGLSEKQIKAVRLAVQLRKASGSWRR